MLDVQPDKNSMVLLMLRLMSYHTKPHKKFFDADDWASIGFFDALQARGWSLDQESAEDLETLATYKTGFLAGIQQAGGDVDC